MTTTTIRKFLFFHSLHLVSLLCVWHTRMHRHCPVVCSTFKLNFLHTDVIFAEKVRTVAQDAVILCAWYVTCKCVEFFALNPPLHKKHHNHRNEKHENYHFFSFTLNFLRWSNWNVFFGIFRSTFLPNLPEFHLNFLWFQFGFFSLFHRWNFDFISLFFRGPVLCARAR